MRLGRLLSGAVLLGVTLGLPMCGSEDARKHVVAAGGEGGEPNAAAGAPSMGGSKTPGNDGGAGDGSSGATGGGVTSEGGAGLGGAAAGEPGLVGGQNGGGQSAEAGAAGSPGAGGVAAFCASDNTSCCGPDEPSCDAGWPAPCGQDMDTHSCCDAGVRQTCSVEYFDANYHVLFGKEECACASGSCDCSCVKGSACPYQEADCNNTSWSDLCVLGSSPTCCSDGVRQKCDYQAGVGKTFTSSTVTDACTGEGF